MRSILSAFLIVTGVLHADVVSILPVADTTLYNEGGGNIGGGADDNLFIGVTGNGRIVRGLLDFDVASFVPSGSVITSAVLTLNLNRTRTSAMNAGLHVITTAWGEGSSVPSSGGGQGGPSTAGGASWIHTFYNTNFWATAGGDFAASASATLTINPSFGFYSFSSAQMVADVQAWLNSPSTDHGWMVRGEEDGGAMRFDARESGTIGAQPTLTIGYTVVPEPATLGFLLAGLAAMATRRFHHA